jgi:large subunit ribosomal protein L6
MSRIGKAPINVPSGVTVTIKGMNVAVKGPKGNLNRDLHETMNINMDGQIITVTPKKDLKEFSKFHGLTRTLINNMVVGVSEGYSKRLKMVGVGYRGVAKGKGLTLTLGYSHPIEVPAIEGIDFKMEGQTLLVVSGADKELVGQTSATIRGYRKPEPYHGKGVRYENERIITKAGKSAGKK